MWGKNMKRADGHKEGEQTSNGGEIPQASQPLAALYLLAKAVRTFQNNSADGRTDEWGGERISVHF